MALKKIFKSRKGQSIVEYIVLFIVFAASIIVCMGGFTPEKLKIKTAFDNAVSNALAEIKR
ncbi:MAG: hypothetical protein ABIH18_08200 [Candidatus Omnitrophota bacterium]